jgi:hypothetical protein
METKLPNSKCKTKINEEKLLIRKSLISINQIWGILIRQN